MTKYSEDSAWSDVVPIPQDDGGPNPLAAIAYTEGYSEAMSYLRALMAKNEMSERALALTEDIIEMNPAHYTVWLYRARILQTLHSDLRKELSWLNATALAHLKNYQIWHHRQFLVDLLDDSSGEIDFINQMLEQDAKNYHVWSYRQWLVRRFGLWTDGELKETERLITEDVRNNSAWNHRFFLVNGRSNDGGTDGGSKLPGEENEDALGVRDERVRDREIEFAKGKIRIAPQNQSPWSYLRGTMEKSGSDLKTLKGFCEEFADVDEEDKVRSSHALDLLAEILTVEGRQKDEQRRRAAKAYTLLAQKFDPIRANYWNFLKGRLDEPAATA